jgi:hypothetical protein
MRNVSPPIAADTSSAYRPAALTTDRAAIVSAGVRSLDAVTTCFGPDQWRSWEDDDVVLRTEARQRAHERLGLEDPGVGREQRDACADVWLARTNEGLIDHAQTLDAVGLAALSQGFERVGLVVIVRDDQLAASAMGDVMCGAELVHQPRPLDAVARLQRAGRIVDPRMNDLTVVRAGAHARPRLAFEHADAMPFARDGQARTPDRPRPRQ